MVTATFLDWTMDVDLHWTPRKEPLLPTPSFFIYDNPAMTLYDGEVCDNRNSADAAFLQALKQHPSRTRNASAAKLFVFPALALQAWKCCEKKWLQGRPRHGAGVGPEDLLPIHVYKPYIQQLRNAFDSLLESPWFRRFGGRDHIVFGHHWQWDMAYHMKNSELQKWAKLQGTKSQQISKRRLKHLHWRRADVFLPRQYKRAIQEVILTRFIYIGVSKWENSFLDARREPESFYHLPYELTKRHVVMPFNTGLPADHEIVVPIFEKWKLRPYLVWYHTRELGSAHGATILRHLPLKTLNETPSIWPESHIGYKISPTEWAKGWAQSRFCLTIRGDTPASHSLYVSLAAGCIPVIIASYHAEVALPFSNHIVQSAFAVEIAESDYVKTPAIVSSTLLGLSEIDIAKKLRYIREVAQPAMLYNHPDSITASLGLLYAVNQSERIVVNATQALSV